MATAGDDAPREAQIETLASLCYLRPRSMTSKQPSRQASGRVPSPPARRASRPLASAHLTLALAAAERGWGTRLRSCKTRSPRSRPADDWGLAATGVIRAIGAAVAGDVSTTAAMAAIALRHADAVDYDAFRVPALLLEGWVLERQADSAAAASAYEAAYELARRVGFADHAAFALAALGSDALAGGNVGEAEALERQALAAQPDYMARGPGVTFEATRWLYEQGVRVMGIDAWGWDAPLHLQAQEAVARDEPGIFWAAHQADLAYCQIERLFNLGALPTTGFTISCFPLKIVGGSAGPTRAVAIVP